MAPIKMAPVNRKSLSIPMAFLLLALIVLVEVVGGYLFFRLLPKPGYLAGLWATAALRLVDFGLILFFTYLAKQGLAAIGMRNWLNGILKGALISLGFGLLVFSTWGVFLLFHLNLLRFIIPPTIPHNLQANFWPTLLIGGTFAPIVEDSFFVGCLYNALRQKFPPPWAVLGVSILFALLHGLRGLPVTQLIGGLVFTLAFEYSKSVLTPISIHILGNCTLFTLAGSSWVRHIL